MPLHRLLFLLLFLTVFTCGWSITPQPAMATDRILIVGTPPEGWPPFIIPDGEEGMLGIMGDVITVIAKKAGMTIQFEFLPEKRLQLYLKDGTIDAYPKAMEWVPDPTFYRWTDDILDVSDIVITQKVSTKSSIPATLLGLNVGVVHGYTYPKLEDSFQDGSIRRHNANSTENLLCMLDHGHVDAILTNPIVANWIIRQTPTLERDRFLYSTTPLDSAPYRFAFTKGWNSQPFINFFNAELKAMKKDGRLQAIINKYQ